jgi:hypothetical protein
MIRYVLIFLIALVLSGCATFTAVVSGGMAAKEAWDYFTEDDQTIIKVEKLEIIMPKEKE